jgi:hypothetical protein
MLESTNTGEETEMDEYSMIAYTVLQVKRLGSRAQDNSTAWGNTPPVESRGSRMRVCLCCSEHVTHHVELQAAEQPVVISTKRQGSTVCMNTPD